MVLHGVLLGWEGGGGLHEGVFFAHVFPVMRRPLRGGFCRGVTVARYTVLTLTHTDGEQPTPYFTEHAAVIVSPSYGEREINLTTEKERSLL